MRLLFTVPRFWPEQRCRQRAADFDWSRAGDVYEELYAELAAA